jgi:hypothetical protein
MISWFLVGRDPRIENVAPWYGPPVGWGDTMAAAFSDAIVER